jgi:hypothetical protein
MPSYGSNASRNTSNSNYTNSVGPGSRPPSRSLHTRSASVRSAAPKNGRPVTSMGVREEEQGKNGTMTPALRLAKKPSSSSLPIKKARKHNSVNDLGAAYAQPLPTAREASICNVFNSLSINGANPMMPLSQANQVTPTSDTVAMTYEVPHNVTIRNRGHDAGAQLVACRRGISRDDPVAPKTPSAKDLHQQMARTDSSWRAVKTPLLSPSPTKTSFLTKQSNATGFVAWDVDERLGTFESEFKAMKDMINNSISGQKSLEEDVAAVRLKGEHYVDGDLFHCQY